MDLYQLGQYLHYRRAAKGRHGVHSPFVYSFIELGLNNPLPKGSHDNPQIRAERYFQPRNLLTSTEATNDYYYFDRQHSDRSELLWERNNDQKGLITRFLKKQVAVPAIKIDELSLIVEQDPKYLAGVFHRMLPLLHDQSFCMVHQIHQSRAMTAVWNELQQEPSVRLSIDLFRIGLLFFNPDFKEKQHFILKCRQ